MNSPNNIPNIVRARSDFLFDAVNHVEMLSKMFDAIGKGGENLCLDSCACSGISETLQTVTRKILDAFSDGLKEPIEGVDN